jgi:hypothetical protein
MDLGELLLPLAVHLVLTALPGVAAALLAARKGEERVPVLLAIGLAASGAVAILSFWAYYAEPVLGESFSYFALFGSIALAGWALYGGHLDRGLLRRLGTPLALWALGSAFLLFLGFVHGGVDGPLVVSAARFSHALPGDNQIPLFYSEWFFHHGHQGATPPTPGGWLASDRPPLQVGYVLSQRPFGWDASGLNYEVIGVLVQQLWIIGLWALLVAAGVGRVTRALAMVSVLVCGLALVNGFFVWPKMLPAAMLLGAAALVLTPLWLRLRGSLWAAGLIAALCGLAMLGHGASVFGIIPLIAVAAYRGLPSRRWVGVALAVGIVLLAPWAAFQKFDSPPGNRLTKWTLAGAYEVDDRGVVEAVTDAYGEAGIGGTLHYKAENFATMSGGSMTVDALGDAFDTGDLTQIIRVYRDVAFFYLLPSFGLLLFAPLAMACGWRRRRRNPAEWSFALVCFATFAAGALAWGLLSFGNLAARTVIHVGTYLLPMLWICGSVAGVRAVFPRFGFGFAIAAALLSLAIYAPALEPLPGTSYSLLAAALAAASLAGFVAFTLRGDQARAAHGVPAAAAQAG